LSLRGITQDIGDMIDNIDIPVVFLDGEEAEVISLANQKRTAGKFHPNISDADPRESFRKKIEARKMLFFKIPEAVHSVLNTHPEVMAVMLNHAVNKYFRLGKNNPAPSDKAV